MWTMRNEPSCVVLRGFAEGFPDLNMNWVFRNEGEMEIRGDAHKSADDTVENLLEKIKMLEMSLADKERTIQILLTNK